jgi:uncharacterized membrane protein
VKTRALRQIWNDESGLAASIIALLGSALIGVSGIALDLGLYFATQRNLQAITESAALSASIDPTNALARAQAFLVSNGYSASVITSLQVGRYCADIDLPATGRFFTLDAVPASCQGNGLSNAVRLQTETTSKRYLTSLLGNVSLTPQIAASATATRIDEAGLEMTSGVLTLDPGLVNSVLSLLAGRNIALTSGTIQALLAANVDAGLMFDALAARVGETGTYSDLTARTVAMSDLLNACATAMQTSGSDPAAIAGMQALASTIGSGVQVPLAKLFELGVWKKMPVGNSNTQPSLRAGLNAYQLLAYALEVNGTSLLGLNATVSGVGNVAVNAMASGPVARARFGFGPQGEISVSTAAARLQLGLSVNPTTLLAGTGFVQAGTNLVAVNVPVLIDIGEGSAEISSISCGQEAASDAQVGINGGAGLLGVYIGTMPANVMTQPFTALSSSQVTPVSLLSVGVPSILGLPAVPVATVNIRAATGPVIGGNQELDFQQAAGGDGTIGHVPLGGTPAMVGSQSQLVQTLSGLQVTTSVTALGVITLGTGPLINGVGKAVAAPVAALGVDPLVTNLLGALGLSAGYANIWVTGVRCGVPVLV